MAKNKLYAHIILDRSGSMDLIRDRAVSAVNEYIHSLASDPEISARVSVTFFHHGYATNTGGFGTTNTVAKRAGPVISHPVTNQKAKDVRILTLEDYVPGGGTPLFDAIGLVNTMISERKDRKHERHALVIMTDGMENSSREFTRAQIKQILTNRQEIDNWLVIFLGANMDAMSEGRSFGTVAANTMTYASSNFRQTGALAAQKTRAYGASGQTMDAAFTDEERTAAVKPKNEVEEKTGA